MKIVKRSGKSQNVSFDKISNRIKKLANDDSLGHIKGVDIDTVSQKVINQIYDGITSKEMDTLAAQICISMSISHPGYAILASRIATSNLQKSTSNTFSKAAGILHKGEVINNEFYKCVCKYKKELDSAIDDKRDYLFDYFAIKTLEKGYLLKLNDVIIERPQYMWMRVAIALHSDDLPSILESYEHLSLKHMTHASPTLFNAGTVKQQMSSCFILSTEDSLDGIYKTVADCARISKYAGGVGVCISNIRAKGSYIKGTNGKSDGVVPMLKVYNETARYINQGGKRLGSYAMYLEPHHADIEDFLELKKNTGDANLRARDLFYALWVCDLFMECVENDKDWYLMCPDECPGLSAVYGDEYKELYNKYVEEKKYRKVIKARDLWGKILVAQTETGTPYIVYKDAVNKKSNQKHLGPITSSNLCAEITLYNTPDSVAVCNIATIGLATFVEGDTYNFEKLGKVARLVTRNLNKVIDLNYYPIPETEKNNTEHRPIAVGVQGLYDTFMKLRYPFDSLEAKDLNKKIFECIQYNCILQSSDLAKESGSYSSYENSPISNGIFQHNMWEVDESTLVFDWEALRQKIKTDGVRNSLMTALPPTASTSQILGNVESFEVITSNLYMRRVLSGDYPIVNKYLVGDLIKLDLWCDDIKNKIIMNDGSVQNIKEIPVELKKLYKTTWETSQKVTISLSADRGPFIDHSQSLNIFMEAPTVSKLSSAHFFGWKAGLKTGSYYIRSRPISNAEKFSIQADKQMILPKEEKIIACSLENPGACDMCSG